MISPVFKLAALGCMSLGLGLMPAEVVAQLSEPSQNNFETLSCLTKDRITAVRRKPGRNIGRAYQACEAELTRRTTSLGLTADQKKIVFLSVLAHSMAPYGASRSVRLKDLLSDKTLDCDNYAILTGHFNRIFLGDRIDIKFVGFDGGAIGNHAQVFVGRHGETLLLDPTIGLVARTGFDDLLMGKPVQDDQILIFRQHDDIKVDFFAKQVREAILTGKYRPTDLLYYFHSIDEYLKFWRENPPEEKNTTALVRRFPTPASQALKRTLAKQRQPALQE